MKLKKPISRKKLKTSKKQLDEFVVPDKTFKSMAETYEFFDRNILELEAFATESIIKDLKDNRHMLCNLYLKHQNKELELIEFLEESLTYIENNELIFLSEFDTNSKILIDSKESEKIYIIFYKEDYTTYLAVYEYTGY